MPNWVDGVIVSVIALGASVLVGILGYLVDKSEGKSEQDKGEEAKSSEPTQHKVEAKRA
jgi:hypothetical protein